MDSVEYSELVSRLYNTEDIDEYMLLEDQISTWVEGRKDEESEAV